MISLIFRSTVRSEDSRKIFMTCCVMVEAPLSLPPRIASTAAAAIPRRSYPLWE